MTTPPTDILETLFELRSDFKNPHPLARTVHAFTEASLSALFPHFCEAPVRTASDLAPLIEQTRYLLQGLCEIVMRDQQSATELVQEFVERLPTFHQMLLQDATAICQGDPAAHSIDEVILAYPGFFAIGVYRVAHWLLCHGLPLVPRLMSELAHSKTGIDIHPGAKIGQSFVIDHGTGIVIGETTLIEDNVKMYQGVTLGALSVDKTLSNTKRHPTIEHGVVIYANATILGGQTVIGAGSIIGGNVWLTSGVPANSRVYHRSDFTLSSGGVSAKPDQG